MTELEKAYIAGIIDGEGSIMLQRFHNNKYPSPCVSIASTTLKLLNWIKSLVGKGIYPCLIINFKKKRAELILNKYKYVTPRNGRYSDELLQEKLNFYNDFISIK